MELLKNTPFLENLATLGKDGIRQIWHDAKLRGRGQSLSRSYGMRGESVEFKDGEGTDRTAVKRFVEKSMELYEQLSGIE